ncbi:hypothetical protein CKAH01_13227 [Colletotrichum kahawae]|uniref:Peptidase S8/S53 domain-containing protein n=1 Tax=Colletotrichum kahawae TaxID=34407 RepID=A0AAD9YPK9_COLKA|nr:hypothetical protein CKAH01_13227 [Colletotrichum kahawae]
MTTIHSGSPPESTTVSTVNNLTSSTTHIDPGSETASSPGTNYESTTGTMSIPPNSLAPTGLPDVTSKAGPVIVIGTETVTITELTSPTTLITIGHTFTIAPPVEGDSTLPYPTFVVIGSKTATLPSVSKATTIVTLDSTFTLFPPTPTSPSPDGPPLPGSSATFNATHAPTGPQSTGSMPFEATSAATDPPSPSMPSLSPTNPVLSSMEPIVAIIGTQTLHLPSVSLDSTITTRGQTITLVSGGPPTITLVEPSEEPSSTAPSSTVDLITFTTWPPQALITPVEVSVNKPEPSEDGESTVIPCILWFFSLCIRFDDINILGWKLILPPGIYPPHLRLDQIIKLPQSISIRGELPPWPKFTVGSDHVPTFPSEPEPTKCETKTASLCATTTPVIVSTLNGAVTTVTTGAPASTCAEMSGCLVADSTHEATVTTTVACETATVSDIVVTCSGGGATACSTRTRDPRTGCDVTAATTTVSCTPAPSGSGKRQVSEGDVPACPMTYEYIVWPRDGKRNEEISAVYAELQKMLPDGGEIEVSAVKDLGVNFWLVHLGTDQAESVRMIPNDSKISWRYQNQYLDEQVDAFEDHTAQMSYISANEGSTDDRYNQRYYFDVSAGEDVPVYIVDTGATMDHIGHIFEDFRMDWERYNKEEGQHSEKLLSEAWILFRKRMHSVLTGLIEKGVFIVTGAGNDGINDGVLGIWNGATIESLEREGFCPYIAGTTNIFRLRRQEDAALTGQCVPGTSPTASAGSTSHPSATATPTGSGTAAPTAMPTTFVCTEETAGKCAPHVICSAPQVNGCVDGKCVCVLPDLPPKTTVVQTTLSTVTSKPPDPVPTPPETPKTPVVLGERKCHDASIYTGTANQGRGGYIDIGCFRYDFNPM